MIARSMTPTGKPRFIGTAQSLQKLIIWLRSFFHVAYGAEEGERRLRRLRARDAFDLWASKADELH